jgi:glycosyltransferase involved in cell wall biosynthesis
MNETYLIFLGKRGGAESILVHQLMLLKDSSAETVLVLSKNFDLKYVKTFKCKVLLIHTPTKVSLLECIRYIKDLILLAKELPQQREKSSAFFVQSSPWDLFLKCYMKCQKFHIISGIHETHRHSGDRWPTKFSTRLDVSLSDELVFWSNFVSQQVKSSKPRSLGKMPSIPISNFKERREENGYVLAIGRIKRYKGFENLIFTFEEEVLKNARLLIAGSGQLRVSAIPPNTTILNRWLSNEEVYELVANAKLVVLPYIEASQSGIIPIAIENGAWILYSKVGGLEEQLEDYNRSIPIDNLLPKYFAKQISNLLRDIP